MSPEQRRRCMQAIHGKDTKPELTVRRYLWRRGYRYRKNVRRLPGTPDIVLKRYGVVIFVHGCFWHGHECRHGHTPATNRAYWEAKIAANRERDARQKKRLRALGWTVITVWECQLNPAAQASTLGAIEYAINNAYLKRHAPRPISYAKLDVEDKIAAETAAEYKQNL